MMRFPPRLNWDLARVRIAQKLFGATRSPLALPLDLADFPAQSELPLNASVDSSSPASSRDLHVLGFVRENAAPAVWIGGDSPLRYPRIGHLAREIVDLGRTVFIETDGTLLRRRIHEFRPVSRLYLVLPLNGLETAHDQRAQQSGNFRATIESIRTAKLSGFHICVETTIFAGTDTEALRTLANFITTLDIDGWIQKRPPLSAADQPSQEKLAAARKLIPNPGWQKFSAYLTLHLPLGAPHAEFACLPAAAGGEVGGVESDSPNQESPIQQESAHVL
jgi:Radical SAM superfamily